jgi:hypothetical protein
MVAARPVLNGCAAVTCVTMRKSAMARLSLWQNLPREPSRQD